MLLWCDLNVTVWCFPLFASVLSVLYTLGRRLLLCSIFPFVSCVQSVLFVSCGGWFCFELGFFWLFCFKEIHAYVDFGATYFFATEKKNLLTLLPHSLCFPICCQAQCMLIVCDVGQVGKLKKKNRCVSSLCLKASPVSLTACDFRQNTVCKFTAKMESQHTLRIKWFHRICHCLVFLPLSSAAAVRHR